MTLCSRVIITDYPTIITSIYALYLCAYFIITEKNSNQIVVKKFSSNSSEKAIWYHQQKSGSLNKLIKVNARHEKIVLLL